jgi:uncharacterized caspase-like protein
MKMTVPRILVAVAILFGLLSTALGNAGRLEKLHGRPMSPLIRSGEAAPLHTNRLALVIGNANYPDADFPLPQVTRDAEGLANALRRDSFRVEVVGNATRSDMTRAIDRLAVRVHPNSTVLVYFGGYSVQSDGENYLIPVDAKIWSEQDVRREGVSIDRLLSKLGTSGARVRLAVIEASRRNPYERRFRVYSHGLAPIQANENTLILSSAAPDQVVDDSDEPHSQLMTVLLARMNSSKGIEEVFKNTRNAVATTRGQQIATVAPALTAGPSEIE